MYLLESYPSYGHLLGTLSLNVSFVLYLIVYVPQLIHNQRPKNLADLSLGLHCLLLFSYSFDLIYGFLNALPWQYKTVSIVGLILVTAQHLQLLRLFICQSRQLFIKLNVAFLCVNVLLVYYFLYAARNSLGDSGLLCIGAIARICGLLYCIPQIINNKRKQSANAISPFYIYLTLILAFLDSVSSWCLSWGWPNKLAAPLSLCLMFYMLYQTKKYAKISSITPMILNL